MNWSRIVGSVVVILLTHFSEAQESRSTPADSSATRPSQTDLWMASGEFFLARADVLSDKTLTDKERTLTLERVAAMTKSWAISRKRELSKWADIIVDDPSQCDVGSADWRKAVTSTGLPAIVMDRRSGLRLSLVPAGVYQRGSSDTDRHSRRNERPSHRVIVSRPFFIGTTECTQGAWVRTGATWEPVREQDKVGSSYPAYGRSFDEVKAFCDACGFRLPWEYEWEYACKCGAQVGGGELAQVAWTRDNSAVEDLPRAVGTLKPNDIGLYDMLGNVAEWCGDAFDEAAYRSADPKLEFINPSRIEEATVRAIRGGKSFFGGEETTRPAFRTGHAANHRLWWVGFRVVRDV